MITTDLLFTCYPDKRIPESDEGQNLQLLLPPANRSMCGYIDEKLLLFTAFWAVIVTKSFTLTDCIMIRIRTGEERTAKCSGG